MAITSSAQPALAGITAAALLFGLVQCSSEKIVLSRALPEGSSTGGFTSGGNVAGGGPASDGLCFAHGDCPTFSVCQDSQCVSCPAVPALCSGPCPFNFFPLLAERNGCEICECVAPSECVSNDDCQPWEICYAGVQCTQGCTQPSCCSGNQCSQPGCGPPWDAAGCVVAGCPGGGSCLSECDREACDCNGVDWMCVGSIGGVTGTSSCAWTCSSP